MKKLTKADILSKISLPQREIEIPEWEGFITIRGLTTSQRLELASVNTKDNSNLVELVSKLISYSLIDPELSIEDVKNLVENDYAGIETIIKAIYALNGMSEETVKAIQDDFLATQKGNSTSS